MKKKGNKSGKKPDFGFIILEAYMQFQNYTNVEGRLVADPELKISKNGKKYSNFSVCFNDYSKIVDESTGKEKWVEYPNFFECVGFNDTAALVSTFKKGQLVSVIGRLEYSTYQGRDGTRRKNISIIVSSIKKLVVERIPREALSGEAAKKSVAPVKGLEKASSLKKPKPKTESSKIEYVKF